MENIEKKINKFRLWARIFTFLLICGVAGLVYVLLNYNDIDIYLIVIVGVVFLMGFYGAPVCCVQYSNLKKYDLVILNTVLKENITEVDKLHERLGLDIVVLGKYLSKYAEKGMFPGYVYKVDKGLVLKNAEYLPETITTSSIEATAIPLNCCPNCGASQYNRRVDGMCDYCGTKMDDSK